MARLYLIRHGRTAWNEQRRIQGQIDVPLDDEGRRQAADLAQCLAEISFTAVWSSPLQRAIETAGPLCERSQLPLQLDPRLMERNWGTYQGLSREEAARRSPQAEAMLRQDPSGARPPGGESFDELQARVEAGLREIAQGANGPVAIVCHGGTIAAGLQGLLRVNAWPLVRFIVDNASVSLVELTPRGEVLAHFINRRYPLA